MKEKLTGGCLCGGVRFELTEAPVWSHSCHCSRCRKSSGAAFASNLFFPQEALSFTQGEDLLTSFKVPEAERFTHVFCRRCGSTLPFLNEARHLVGVPMGTLDDDPGYSPLAHIFVGSKAPWFEITDTTPQHAEHLVAPKR
jgi:hypothetical protein